MEVKPASKIKAKKFKVRIVLQHKNVLFEQHFCFSVEANLPGHILDKNPLPPIPSKNEDNLRPMTALAPKTQLPRIDHPKPPLPLETIPSSNSTEKVLNLDESSASTLLGKYGNFLCFFFQAIVKFRACAIIDSKPIYYQAFCKVDKFNIIRPHQSWSQVTFFI